MSSPVIEMVDVTKSYQIGDHELKVLKGINFSVHSGEMVSIIGSSGSGKSTLMNIIGLLDRHKSGIYRLDGKRVSFYTDDELAGIRGKKIGFVFQSYFLLPRLTAMQNVAVPLLYQGIRGPEAQDRCREMLARVGMADYIDHRPNEMSGGQQQRVAVARALVGGPSLLLADEPTGALDSKIGQEVMNLFIELNENEKVTMVIITHDPKIAAQCKREVRVHDGLVVEEEHQA